MEKLIRSNQAKLKILLDLSMEPDNKVQLKKKRMLQFIERR